jgi:glycine cleavage system aminomethyltransferase T
MARWHAWMTSVPADFGGSFFALVTPECPGLRVELEDVSDSIVALALQGPNCK